LDSDASSDSIKVMKTASGFIEVPQKAIEEFKLILGKSNVLTEPKTVEKLSKDFFWYSPILSRQLKDKRADVVLKIDNRESLQKIIPICCRGQIPVTVRGGGTGNYGQCIPLYGGVVLDLGGMNRIISIKDGVARVEPAVRLITIETEGRKLGWELRCMPSTFVKSSVAGFLCGGSAGIGSVTWGGINNGDNIKSITLMSIEEKPRILKFRERECMSSLHTYGTTGILVEAEIRLAPKVPYDQHIFIDSDWDHLLDWADSIASDPTIRKRLVTQFEWPIPSYFLPLRRFLPEGFHSVFLLVDREQSAEVKQSAENKGIRHTHTIQYREPLRPPYLTDYTWNHTTLWAIKKDSILTYSQLNLGENFRKKIRSLWNRFPEEIMMHLEWIKGIPKSQNIDSGIFCGCMPLIRFRSEERLREISNYFREIDIFEANPHTFYLEDGAAHPDIAIKRQLKSETDPLGILNPGKMRTYQTNPFEPTFSENRLSG